MNSQKVFYGIRENKFDITDMVIKNYIINNDLYNIR